VQEHTLHIKVGKRIQEIRTDKNLSQQDLAANCNYEKSYMSRIEAGKTDARLSTYNKIAKGLDVDLMELFRF